MVPTSTRRRPFRPSRVVTAGLLALAATLAAAGCQPLPPARGNAQPRGVDVSNYQHPGGAAIDWGAVRDSGIEYAFVKASEGPVSCTGGYYTNSWFSRDWTDVGRAGLYRGAYHFGRPGDAGSALAQARYFANVVGPLGGSRDLPPVLDLEVTCGRSPAEVAAFARVWVDEVARLTGRQAMIYTGYYFWRDQVGNDPSFSNLPLWVATYGPRPMVPSVWSNWTFWQYSSSGSVPGIQGAVDVNLFNFGSEGLARYASDGAHNPFGVVDETTGAAGTVRVRGWTLDPDIPEPTNVEVYVDGASRATGPAGDNRPDVGAVYPASGPRRGFDLTVRGLSGGRHEVCVFAVNLGPGTNTLLNCSRADVRAVQPYGSVDAVTGRFGTVSVQGWAADPDTADPIRTDVYVDGSFRGSHTADIRRLDVAAALGVAPERGFDLTIDDVARGVHNVCVFGINVGPGDNQLIGCRTATVPGGSPLGHVDQVSTAPRAVRVEGWTFDPDSPASIPSHIYLDGRGAMNLMANGNRADVGAYFPDYGPAHGIDATLTGLAPGDHDVCTFGIDIAGGDDNRLLDCRRVTVPGGPPIGAVSSVTPGPGSVHIIGWTFDPDTAASIPAHLYVDGRFVAERLADVDVPSIGAFFRGWGSRHGIDVTLTGLAPGVHSVCTFGLDVMAPGENRLLDCRDVAVP